MKACEEETARCTSVTGDRFTCNKSGRSVNYLPTLMYGCLPYSDVLRPAYSDLLRVAYLRPSQSVSYLPTPMY